MVTLTVSLSEVIRLLLSLTILTQYPANSSLEKKNKPISLSDNIKYSLLINFQENSQQSEGRVIYEISRVWRVKSTVPLLPLHLGFLPYRSVQHCPEKKKKKKRLSLSGPRVRFSKVLVTLWPRKAVIIFIPDGGFKGLKTQPDNKQLKKQNGLVRMPETTTYSNLILKYGFRPV